MKKGDIFTLIDDSFNRQIVIQIGMIEELEGSEVVHISVLDEKYCEILSHAPFSREALEKEDLSFIKNKPLLAEFLAGYQVWREYYSKGQAGIFAGPLLEVLVLPAPD